MCDLSGWQIFGMVVAGGIFLWIYSGFIYYVGRRHEQEEIERFQRKKRQWDREV